MNKKLLTLTFALCGTSLLSAGEEGKKQLPSQSDTAPQPFTSSNSSTTQTRLVPLTQHMQVSGSKRSALKIKKFDNNTTLNDRNTDISAAINCIVLPEGIQGIDTFQSFKSMFEIGLVQPSEVIEQVRAIVAQEPSKKRFLEFLEGKPVKASTYTQSQSAIDHGNVQRAFTFAQNQNYGAIFELVVENKVKLTDTWMYPGQRKMMSVEELLKKDPSGQAYLDILKPNNRESDKSESKSVS